MAQTRIDDALRNVRDEADTQHQQGAHEEDPLDVREIVLRDGLEQHAAEAGKREDGLDDHGPQEGRGEFDAEDGDDRNRAVAQAMRSMATPIVDPMARAFRR